MRTLLLLIIAFGTIIPASASAYVTLVNDLATPYEVLLLEQSPSDRQLVVGELDGYPEMIEFTTDTETALNVTILTLPDLIEPQFGGIVVRVLDSRGVEEVARLKPAEATWEAFREPVSKLSFLVGPHFEAAIAPGTYRIEVSTPENFGKYLLAIGDTDVTTSYGETWQSVATLYEFAEVTKLGMVRTSLVYVPILIILIIGGFGYTVYRTRHRLPFFNRYA